MRNTCEAAACYLPKQKIIIIDCLSIKYFGPTYALFVLLHELGHHVSIFHKNNEFQDSQYHTLLKEEAQASLYALNIAEELKLKEVGDHAKKHLADISDLSDSYK